MLSNLRNAPPSILNVQVNQPVELRVSRRTEESYQAAPKVNKPFSGSGNRLGAPTGLEAVTQPATQSIPGAFPSSNAQSSGAASGSGSTFDESQVASISTRFEVDMSLPTTSVQIRLADGTR